MSAFSTGQYMQTLSTAEKVMLSVAFCRSFVCSVFKITLKAANKRTKFWGRPDYFCAPVDRIGLA